MNQAASLNNGKKMKFYPSVIIYGLLGSNEIETISNSNRSDKSVKRKEQGKEKLIFHYFYICVK